MAPFFCRAGGVILSGSFISSVALGRSLACPIPLTPCIGLFSFMPAHEKDLTRHAVSVLPDDIFAGPFLCRGKVFRVWTIIIAMLQCMIEQMLSQSEVMKEKLD